VSVPPGLSAVPGPAIGDRAPIVQCHSLDHSPALERHYGATADDRLVLLRPDGYVGFHCLASEADALERHLEVILI